MRHAWPRGLVIDPTPHDLHGEKTLMTNKHAMKAVLGTLALTATLGLAGCSDNMGGMEGMSPSSSAPQSSAPSASTSSSVSTEFNDADVMFVQMMMPHHEQAVAMSDTLLEKSGVDPEVTALAEEIKAAQQPEIDTMKSWLAAWGKDEMADGMGGMGGMDHGGGDDGMATADELEEFEKADGATGQRMYLEMMTAHHKGAIAMAQAEIADGENPEAIEMAKEIVATQQQEITVMADLLAKL